MKFTKHPLLKALNKLVRQASLYMTKTHQHNLHSIAEFEARNLAMKNLPGVDEPSIEHYLTSIRSAYIAVKKEVSILLNAGIQKALGMVNMATVNQKIEYIRAGLRDEQERRSHLEIDKGRIHLNEDYSTYQKQKITLLFFGIGECIWTMMAFVALGDILILSMFLGVVIGLAQISVTKAGVQIIKEEADKARQALFLKLLGGGLIVLSIIMGFFRYYFVHAGAGAAVPFFAMNPLTFSIINLLFIAATGLLVFHYYPSKEEMKKMAQIEKLDKEITLSVKQSRVMEKDMISLQNERELLIELRSKIIHDEKKLLEQVDAFYMQATGQFKHENLVKRSDGRMPIAFKNNFDPLPKTEIDDHLFLKT